MKVKAAIALEKGKPLIIDYVDLDSHYNLSPDPSSGAKMVNWITMTNNSNGHGAQLNIENYAE